MPSLACVQAKLRWALEPVLATLVKDTQMISKLFLKIPTSSSSRSSMTIVFFTRLICVYSWWRNQDVLRKLKPTGLVLLMTESQSPPPSPWPSFQTPAMIWDLLGQAVWNTLQWSLMNVFSAKAEPAHGQHLSTGNNGSWLCWGANSEPRTENLFIIKLVCSIATFEY